jgi:hypothetical protein
MRQKARWQNTRFRRAHAGDRQRSGFYSLMEARGYDRPELDRCLADKALAERLAQHTKDATEKDFVNGTPSFLLNGVPLSGTYSAGHAQAADRSTAATPQACDNPSACWPEGLPAREPIGEAFPCSVVFHERSEPRSHADQALHARPPLSLR